MARHGFVVAREVEVRRGRIVGWIDLLAYHPVTRLLILVEIKTRLDDLGAIERQLGWYERHAFEVARALGWEPRRVSTWLLALASYEVERTIRDVRGLFDRSFPRRARVMDEEVTAAVPSGVGRGLALIDPARRSRRWLIPSRSDGRRSAAPYVDNAAAARAATDRPAGPGRGCRA